jgi:hypothetical protein
MFLERSEVEEPFVSCQACQGTHRQDAGREMLYSSFQRSVSVRSRAEVIITHMPSTSDACEVHAQPVEKSIASLALRLC